MSAHHVAQLNIARPLGPIDGPQLADFMALLPSMRRRREWFAPHDSPHLVLWWVPAGHRPTFDEARDRLDLLAARGPGPEAFTLREAFPPPDTVSAAA